MKFKIGDIVSGNDIDNKDLYFGKWEVIGYDSRDNTYELECISHELDEDLVGTDEYWEHESDLKLVESQRIYSSFTTSSVMNSSYPTQTSNFTQTDLLALDLI